MLVRGRRKTIGSVALGEGGRLEGTSRAWETRVFCTMQAGIRALAAGGRHPLDGTDWADVLRRLRVYAIVLYRADWVMAGTGKSPSDLVGDVIVELLEGKIRYDGRRPLVPVLKKALYHDFLDMKKSAERRTTTIREAGVDAVGETTDGLDDLPATVAPAPDVMVRESVYEAIGDDQLLRDFAYAILECGAGTPTDIAGLLGTTTDDVENRRKRLRRRLAYMRTRPEA